MTKNTSIIMNKNKDWVSAVIIEDDDSDKELLEEEMEIVVKVKKEKKVKEVKEEVVKEKRKRNVQQPLKWFFNEDPNVIEMGIDEAGRGPMFGRVYAGVVILPKDDSFDHSLMKDSKKFTSKNNKKIQEVAEYIKANAIAWAVEYEDEAKIDEVNILQATQLAMHKGIKTILKAKPEANTDNTLLLVDGNYFKPYMTLNKAKTKLEKLKYEMIEGGDNKYTAIAAASILAKVERDKYIEELCIQNPELIERYAIDSNKGYGSKKHMDGIKQYGITKWHRRTFGICKEY
jgi:ribonuclease HII